MDDDSRPTALGLAQAVLDWIDPALLDALRAAEAQCDPDELEQLQRDPVARILDRRARPQRGRVIQMAGSPPEIAAWDRAWNAVMNALRLKIETGEIALTARMIRPDMRMESEPIPSVWANELDFDIRGAAIFVREQTYVAVTVAKPRRSDRSATPVDDSEPGAHAPAVNRLPLLDAMTQWCDPKLVARIRDEERKLIAYELHQFPKPKLLQPSEWRQPTSQSWKVPTDYVFLTAAWDALMTDFRRCMEQGRLFLEGVPSGDDPHAVSEPIPAMWAAELRLDLAANVVSRGERRWLAVAVSKSPLAPVPAERPHHSAIAESVGRSLSEEEMRKLTDDEVLDLLEEHARRVVENDARMMAPGKISLIPIVKRKLEYRAQHGLLEDTIAAEAAVLARWIADRLASHHTPTAGTIENVLRKDYAALRARSNGMIQ
jgi:hypothetical protein